jgi:hypothetical protein
MTMREGVVEMTREPPSGGCSLWLVMGPIRQKLSQSKLDQIKYWVQEHCFCESSGILLLHRHHQFLLERGDTQFQDYHVGDTIFLSHLLNSGFLIQDENGIVFDVDQSKARPALESLAERIFNVKKGSDSILSFKNSLYNDARIFNHFVGWKEHQNYFEKIWGSR